MRSWGTGPAAPSQHSHVVGGEVLNGDAVVAAIQGHHRELCAILAQARTRVVAAPEGDALWFVARPDGHAINLRATGTVGREVQGLAVTAPRR